MKMKPAKTVSLGLLIGFVPLLLACGSDSKESASPQTMVVEVGNGHPDLWLAEGEMTLDSDGTVTNAEVKQCEGVFAGPVAGWKISGNQNQVDLAPTQAFATKISGNRNKLNLTIKAKEGETGIVNFPGVCLVLSGNQASVALTLEGVSLEKLKVLAHGNSGSLSITLASGANIPGGAVADLGKHVTVTLAETLAEK